MLLAFLVLFDVAFFLDTTSTNIDRQAFVVRRSLPYLGFVSGCFSRS